MRNCLNCNVPTKNPKFCGCSCSATYINTGRKQSKETKRKIRASVSDYLNTRSKRVRKLTSEKIRAGVIKSLRSRGIQGPQPKVCGSCGKTFTRNAVFCSNECYRIYAQKRALAAIHTGSGRKGYRNGIWCQSSYELAFVVWFEDQGKVVERSSITLDYTWKGKHHKYRPDFLVEGVTYEIKGYIDQLAKAKIKVGKKHIELYEVFDRNTMRPIIQEICKKYNKTPETLQELYNGTGGTIRTCAALRQTSASKAGRLGRSRTPA